MLLFLLMQIKHNQASTKSVMLNLFQHLFDNKIS